MAVPGFQDFMLPVLQIAGDGAEHKVSEALAAVSEHLRLSSEDMEAKLPSGLQTQAQNRCAWAVVYLERAGLLARPRRGWFIISERGRDVLRQDLGKLTIKYLQQFPEFAKFRSGGSKPEDKDDINGGGADKLSPEERLEAAHHDITESLADELLGRVKSCGPKFFEHLVIDLLVQMGYGGSRADAAQVVGKAGDGGIDGTIKEDRLGLDTIYVQAKRWEGNIGRKEIQAFAGSLEGERATKGVFITTSSFTSDAMEYAGRIGRRIVLIDGVRLAQLMIEHNVGCSEHRAYSLKRVDNDYFEDV